MGSKVGWEASKDMLPDLVIYLDCPKAMVTANKERGVVAFASTLFLQERYKKDWVQNKKVFE